MVRPALTIFPDDDDPSEVKRLANLQPAIDLLIEHSRNLLHGTVTIHFGAGLPIRVVRTDSIVIR